MFCDINMGDSLENPKWGLIFCGGPAKVQSAKRAGAKHQAHLRGSGGMLPRNFLKNKMQIGTI